MANHKSAFKRAIQNEIRRIRNKSTKTSIKKVTKEVRLSLNEDSGEMRLKKLNTAQSLIDKAAKKGVIHKKTAARKISRLSKLVVTTAI
ncbi:MAG: 30S ribosomal protein S20 [Desulfobacteraceae bacterium]|nr:30S ribosomal protein S20 [Desulfobacteraceae bacterium]MBC2720983.1 30S ribosomal protein S20 [Desulfobacteraceae bacterium]